MMIEQGRYDSMQETVDAIAQLATTPASDRGTVATLTTNNAKLANQVEAAYALIAQLKNEIVTLKNKIKPARQGQLPIKTTNSRVNDRPKQDIIAGRMATRWINRTSVQHARLKKRTSRCCNEDRHHGWRAMGQRMTRRGS
jgi:endonuclease/exonuclease/phosphatase (EEP) superfamily protein YafD